ncbi:sensor histidine kinase [Paenibacillus rhizoplanae]
MNVSGAYEVEQLSKRFNMMLQRIRQLMEQIIYEQETKRKGELEVLQSQINPHFSVQYAEFGHPAGRTRQNG